MTLPFRQRPLGEGAPPPESITLHRIGIAPPRPPGVYFVLWAPGAAKPQGFRDFAAFVRFLHRRRAGRPLQITAAALSVDRRDRRQGFETLHGVTVHVLDPVTAQPHARLGFAWLSGHGVDTLRAALRGEG